MGVFWGQGMFGVAPDGHNVQHSQCANLISLKVRATSSYDCKHLTLL